MKRDDAVRRGHKACSDCLFALCFVRRRSPFSAEIRERRDQTVTTRLGADARTDKRADARQVLHVPSYRRLLRGRGHPRDTRRGGSPSEQDRKHQEDGEHVGIRFGRRSIERPTAAGS